MVHFADDHDGNNHHDEDRYSNLLNPSQFLFYVSVCCRHGAPTTAAPTGVRPAPQRAHSARATVLCFTRGPLPKSWRRALRWINEGAQASRSGNRATEGGVVSHRAAACPSAIMCGMPLDPERRKQLRSNALEHLEAARSCLDESGDAVGNYLVERAIDEVTSQQWPALDPFSVDWPTNPK